jgi:hypothetical protein
MAVNRLTTSGEKTVKDLLSSYDLKQGFTSQSFLKFSSNWDKIKRQYNVKELKDNEKKYSSGDFDGIVIKPGTVLSIDNADLFRDLSRPKQMPDVEFLTDYKAFMASAMYGLLKDPKYYSQIRSDEGAGMGKVYHSDVSVYVWVRALSGSNEQAGTWMNVSAFVKSVQTNVGAAGGTFSISLAPIEAEYVEGLGWQPKNVEGYASGDLRDDYISQSHISRPDKKTGDLKRSDFYFHTVLQENDLFFIKFERLGVEKEKLINYHGNVGGVINSGFVANNVFDMIGLVDSCTLSTNPGDAIVEVTGRDLMKILIEDGSYFYPEQFGQNIFNDEDSLLAKRNRFELVAQNFTQGQYVFRSVETILKFIFNKFSNLGVVPNSIFSGFGARAKRKKYELKSSLMKKEGVELIEQIDSGFFAKEDRQGIWQIVDFIFDPQAGKRILADNTIATDNGSIINSIQKICQEPFVEFAGDTYGDRYYFTIRKPPFDRRGYTGAVYDNVLTEDQQSSVNVGGQIFARPNSDISSVIITVNEQDLKGEPKFEYDQTAYSWYRIVPRGLGLDDAALFRLAAVVALDEYAKVWGNKTLSIEYNYCPTQYIQDAGVESELNFVEAQVYADLQYLIQSNAYLPFTRRGTITMCGDRTIKRGNFIYYKPTDEVFHVDSVSNFAVIDGEINERITTLQVSRGMREKYIRGVQVKFPSGVKKVSYFDIVNTDIVDRANINNATFLKNWKTDADIFNFFIQRRQWA